MAMSDLLWGSADHCRQLEAQVASLDARCAELMNAVDRYIDERDKAMTENEHFRKKVQQQERSLHYLTGVKDTVEVIFGRKFDGP